MGAPQPLGNPDAKQRLRFPIESEYPLRTSRLRRRLRTEGLDAVHPSDLGILYSQELRWLREGGVTGWGPRWDAYVKDRDERRKSGERPNNSPALEARIQNSAEALAEWKRRIQPLLDQFDEMAQDASWGEKAAHAAARLAQIATATTRSEVDRALTALDKLHAQYEQKITVSEGQSEGLEDVKARLRRIQGGSEARAG